MLTTFFVDGDLGDDTSIDGTVENPFATIQRGIEQADKLAGADKIVIASGTYVGQLNIEDDHALRIEGSGDVTIKGGVGDVINITSSDVTLKNLTITNGGNNGIDAKGGSLRLEKVEVVENANDGLVGNGLGVVVIKNSRFAGNGKRGIDLVDLESLELKNVTAENNDDDGARFSRVKTSVLVNNSEFVNNGDDDLNNAADGFVLKSVAGTTVIKNSQFSGNAQRGLELDNLGDVEFKKVRAENNGQDGAVVDNFKSIEVNRSEFHDNGLDGLELARSVGATVVVKNVKANGNVREGLDVNDVTGSVSIKNSKFDDNRIGIEIDKTSDVKMKNVSARFNELSGLDLSTIETLVLDRVTAKDNGEHGAVIFDVAMVEILKGKYSRNGLDGINASGVDRLLLNKVDAKDNVMNGLAISGGQIGPKTDVTIVKGSYSKNGADGINIINAGAIGLSRVKGEKNGEDGLDVSNSGEVTDEKVKFKKNAILNVRPADLLT